VVLRIDPEDGHGGNAMIPRHLFGNFEGRERLEQCEQRTAKEARLLPGEDGDGARIAELARRLHRARRRTARRLLGADDLDQVGATVGMRLRARNGLRPGIGVAGIAGEEGGQSREVVRVVGRQRTNPREAAKIDRDASRGLGRRTGSIR
jgi:hypothetical protein